MKDHLKTNAKYPPVRGGRMLRNRWPDQIGTGGRMLSDSVAEYRRNAQQAATEAEFTPQIVEIADRTHGKGQHQRVVLQGLSIDKSIFQSLSYRVGSQEAAKIVIVLNTLLSPDKQASLLEDELRRISSDGFKDNGADLDYWFKRAREVLTGPKNELKLDAVVIPAEKSSQGTLISSVSIAWHSIIEQVGKNWDQANDIPPQVWEEIIAGAYSLSGFDEVTLTPRSGDFGRDVIAVRKGVGCIKIIGSVKAYKPGHLVKHDDVRALLGVLSGESDASKGIISTTSDFAPRIASDPFIKPFLPTRLELMNGDALRDWLMSLSSH